MKWLNWLSPLLPLSLWIIGGCATPEYVQALVSPYEKDLADLKNRASYLESIVGYCSDEETTLLKHVEAECQEQTVCTSASIPIEVIKVDPSHEGRFMTLLKNRKHVVFYFPIQARELGEPERKALRDLVKPAWRDDGARRTRFLVTSNPGEGNPAGRERAEKNAKLVIDAISDLADQAHPSETEPVPLKEFPAGEERVTDPAGMVRSASVSTAPLEVPEPPPAGEKLVAMPSDRARNLIKRGRVLYWLFPFLNPKELPTLPPEDRPRKGDSIYRSVAVYRVDC